MSLSAAAIRAMADKGMTAQDIADIAEAMEGPVPQLSAGALRTRKWRENKAAGVTGDVTVTHHGDVSHVGERSQVVTPSLPSLRSEELKIPPEKPSVSTPKGAKPRGSKRVPTSWIPGRQTLSALEGEGYSPGDLERALTRMRDHEFRTPRSDWDAAYRNWVRSDADRKPRHERPHHDAKFEARQANLAAHERGADLAARLRRES